MTTVGDENIFGKQRGRFDEGLARIIAATLPDKFLTTFMAMTPDQQNACVAKFNAFFERPGLDRRYVMTVKP